MALLTSTWTTDIIIFISTLFTIIYLFYQRKFQYWANRNVQFVKPSFPMGNLTQANWKRTFALVFSDVYNQGQGLPFIGCWKFFKPTLVIRDLDLVKSVLVKDFNVFHDRGISVDEKVEPLGAHLFLLPGQQWKNLRAKLAPTFSSGKMKGMFPIIVDIGKHLTSEYSSRAADNEIVEVKDMMSRYTTDVIASCAFGLEINNVEKPDTRFTKMGSQFFKPTPMEAIKNLIFLSFPDLIKALRIPILSKETNKFFTEVFKETVESREKTETVRKDFVHLLIQLMKKGYVEGDGVEVDTNHKVPESEKFTLEKATAQAFIFFVAGYESSSTHQTFMLYELAKNPEIQEKTRQNIREVLAKHSGQLTYEAMMEMNYLDRVEQETVRLYPGPMLFRQASRDYKVPGYDLLIEKGTDVVIPTFGIHRDPLVYKDPLKFDPDRWLPEEKAKRHQYSFMGFGEGPHQCIGMRFAQMSTKVVMISILTNFKVDACDKTMPEMIFDPKANFVTPASGVFVRLSKLTD